MVECGKDDVTEAYNILDCGKKENSYTVMVSSQELPIRPQRGRPKRKPTEHEWTYESTELLIEIFRSHSLLYDIRHPEYHKRDRKEKAFDDIRDELAENGVYVEIADITSKMTSLKSYFCQERRKMAASKTAPGGEIYVSRWKFFPSLEFLGDTMLTRNHYSASDSDAESTPSTESSSQQQKIDAHLRKTIIKHETPPPPRKQMRDSFDVNNTDIVIVPPCPPATSATTITMTENNNNNNNNIRTSNFELIQPPPSNFEQLNHQSAAAGISLEKTEDDVFGELIAKKLKRIRDGFEKETLKMKIQLDINNVLFKPNVPHNTSSSILQMNLSNHLTCAPQPTVPPPQPPPTTSQQHVESNTAK